LKYLKQIHYHIISTLHNYNCNITALKLPWNSFTSSYNSILHNLGSEQNHVKMCNAKAVPSWHYRWTIIQESDVSQVVSVTRNTYMETTQYTVAYHLSPRGRSGPYCPYRVCQGEITATPILQGWPYSLPISRAQLKTKHN